MFIRTANLFANFCSDIGECNAANVADTLTEGLFPVAINDCLRQWYQNGQRAYRGQSADWAGFTFHGTRPEIRSLPQSVCGRWGFLDHLWDRATDLGHDLPTWFSRGTEEPTRRIMIVSQDPLRNNLPRGSLHLSSPFGFHCAEYRSSASDLVRQVVCRLLEENVAVYLTDAMKIYFSFANQTTCLKCRQAYLSSTQFNWKNEFRSVVDREILLFNPTLVVLMGRPVVNMMLDRFNSAEFDSDKLRLLRGSTPLAMETRTFSIGNRQYDFLPIWHLTSAHVALSHEQKVDSFTNSILTAN